MLTFRRLTLSATTRIVWCCLTFALAVWLRSPLVGLAILALLPVLRAMAKAGFRGRDVRSRHPRRLTA
jgi:hypothetical protein